jgi:hypothetical protein
MRKKYFGGEGVKCSLAGMMRRTAADGSTARTTTIAAEEGSTSGGRTNERSHRDLDGEIVDDRKPSAARGTKSSSSTADDATASSSRRLEYVFGSDGVVEIYAAADFRRTNNLIVVPPLSSFASDYQRLVEMASSGVVRSFSFQRLQMLSSAFKMHVTVNGAVEDEAQSELLGTDFYRTMKVDNHIHLAAAASAKQFVNFVRDKLENEGDTVVMEDGQTLREVFRRAGLDSDHLTIDAFSVLADYSTYQRFDNFNDKYSPFRMAQMRKIFLKTDNHIDGRCVRVLTAS